MGWARNWGPQHAARTARVENAIRVGIPALGAGTLYVGYEIGDELWEQRMGVVYTTGCCHSELDCLKAFKMLASISSISQHCGVSSIAHST